ncbi:MAG: DUF503 domain-containing protein [bacterium]
MLGYYQIEIFIPGALSLKDKRFVVQSLKDKVKKKFNVSVAELDGSETWQRSVIGMAMVSNDQSIIENSFDKIIRMLDQDARFEIIDRQIEFYN